MFKNFFVVKTDFPYVFFAQMRSGYAAQNGRMQMAVSWKNEFSGRNPITSINIQGLENGEILIWPYLSYGC